MEEQLNQIKTDREDGRVVEAVVPVAWHGWDELEPFVYQFYGVVITEDFGSISAGSEFDAVVVDYDKGIFEAYDAHGVVQVTLKFKAMVDVRDVSDGDE